MAYGRSAGIRTNWLDRAEDILGFSDQILLQNTANLRIQVKEVEVFLQQPKSHLKQTEESLTKMNKAASPQLEIMKSKFCRAYASLFIVVAFVFSFSFFRLFFCL